MLYRVAKKPDGWLGLVVYLLTGRAGDGVLIGKNWFHFRHGRFVRDSKALLMRTPGYIVAPVRKATAADSVHFWKAVGKRWGFRNNCLLTVTLRLLRKP